MKSLKELFIDQVVSEASTKAAGEKIRVMDLGCGTASYVPALIEKYPNLEYVGVEPIEKSYQKAEENLGGVERSKVHFQLAYDQIPEEKEGSFDLVFSLSVLEHVKHLQSFIDLSAKYVKSGGTLMHRYDLGHALHTHSIKEAVHVWLGNNFPQILPERQFVRYVGVPEVETCYKNAGVTPSRVSYHQMLSHKKFEKFFKDSNTEIMKDLFDWEMSRQSEILTIPEADREHLFPAVAVWGTKN